jgi:peptide-methionine (R)-S-oxide reductase
VFLSSVQNINFDNYRTEVVKDLNDKQIRVENRYFCIRLVAQKIITRTMTTISKYTISFSLLLFCMAFLSCHYAKEQENTKDNKPKIMDSTEKITKTEEEWKKILSPEQYNILRNKGTERPGTGEYNNHSQKGVYTCAGCGTELFTSDQKFDSHCGWPSFDNNIAGGDRVKQVKDFSHGMIRTEIVCAKCGGHLGHIFDDGPTATGQRYCVNSLSLGFKPDADAH